MILVCGPPGAGKTTRARALAAAQGLTVYDRDDARWTGEREFRAALDALRHDPVARVVVIRACATRSAWQKVAAQVGATGTELVMPTAAVCRDRIAHDTRVYVGHTWGGRASRLSGVTTWFDAHAADPWQASRPVLTPSREW